MSSYPPLDQLLSDLSALAGESQPTTVPSDYLAWLDQLSEPDVAQLLTILAAHLAEPGPAQDHLLAMVFNRLTQNASLFAEDMDGPGLASLVTLYRQLGPDSNSRHHLLRWVAMRADETLTVFAELIVQDPPAAGTDVLVAFAPLFQRQNLDVRLLFPRLLDALSNPQLAASVLDLANFWTRQELVSRHPAAERRERLVHLLGDLTQELAQLDEQVEASCVQNSSGGEPDDPELVSQRARVVEDTAALIVSLCDALALIGDQAAIGKLYQVLELRHRRLRTEAAAALARFGEAAGVRALAEMASEPVMRLRVLAYAEEVGCLDEVDLEHQTEAARAEAELAVWLADSNQFGIPPSKLERVDQRLLYWPGYDDEVDCFLFRFSYRMAAGEYENIGIAGPCTHTFAADLADLPPDDIYAAFAGWQAEHEDIYEIELMHLPDVSEAEVARFGRRLHDEGYELTESLKIGSFFGERALIARARRGAVSGVAVADQHTIQWHAEVGARPIDAEIAYCIYKGRKLLRSFNAS